MAINDRDFERLVTFVRNKYGINLEHKRTLIDARLTFDIARHGFSDFTQYVNKVTSEPNGQECSRMINRLSTNYTFFFREQDFITQLCNKVLPAFLSEGRNTFRIWSAACSSGQEAYSIAMVLELNRRLSGKSFRHEITGTDINTEMLEVASAGVYPESELSSIPEHYRQFVTPHSNGSFSISGDIKNKVTWEYGNLLDPVTVQTDYDIIFCRNVMIYFTPELRRDMTKKLYARLRHGGYLFTGATESIDLERKYFRYISPAFYQKT